jgi:hypothetical protein
MWTLFLVIVVVALLLIACAFIDMPSWRKRAKENSEPSHIEKVREAAFAVIEASLEAEPQKWGIISKGQNVQWLANPKTEIGIWLGGGPTSLFVITKLAKNNTPAERIISDQDKLVPALHIRSRLYTAAMSIASGKLEKIEEKRLSTMVSAFGHVLERSRNNDQTAA